MQLRARGREFFGDDITAAMFAHLSPGAGADAEAEVVARQRRRLRLVVLAGDAIALGVATAAVLVALGATHRIGVTGTLGYVCAAVVLGLWTTGAAGLWLRRVCAMRTVEISRLTRATGLLGIGLVVIDRLLGSEMRLVTLVVMPAAAWFALVTWRSIVRVWVSGQRRAGRRMRRAVIVGSNQRAAELVDVARCHPEQGLSVVGVVGPTPPSGAEALADLRIAPSSQAVAAIEHVDPECVVVCTNGLEPRLLNQIVSRQHDADREVMIDPGISPSNLSTMEFAPVGYQPLLHVEKSSLSRPQLVAKRIFDFVVSALLLLLASPVLLIVALVVKLSDGGPMLFRQQRVGLNGETFPVLKFRTMAVDAEARLAALLARNERNGPLFKLDDDPRVTRFGRFLRDSSLDELPQLVNVLCGSMSLIGPRPALPAEVRKFSRELRKREQMKPGITGLWQVEARDNPSFSAYERLDLYYIENWSLALDMVLLIGTVEQVIGRLIGAGRRHRADRADRAEAASPAHVAMVTPVSAARRRETLVDEPAGVFVDERAPA